MSKSFTIQQDLQKKAKKIEKMGNVDWVAQFREDEKEWVHLQEIIHIISESKDCERALKKGVKISHASISKDGRNHLSFSIDEIKRKFPNLTKKQVSKIKGELKYIKHGFIFHRMKKNEYRVLRLTRKEIIGRGGFGYVKLAESRDGEKFAVKVEKGAYKKEDTSDEKKASRKTGLLKGELKRRSRSGERKFYQILDFKQGATLDDFIMVYHNALKDNNFLKLVLLCECLIVVEKLHGHGFIHGDVKPQNIMVNLDELTLNLDAALIDFGASIKGGRKGRYMKLKDIAIKKVGSKLMTSNDQLFAAPEVLGNVYTNGVFRDSYMLNAKWKICYTSDIYSLGVMALNVLKIDKRLVKDMLEKSWDLRPMASELVLKYKAQLITYLNAILRDFSVEPLGKVSSVCLLGNLLWPRENAIKEDAEIFNKFLGVVSKGVFFMPSDQVQVLNDVLSGHFSKKVNQLLKIHPVLIKELSAKIEALIETVQDEIKSKKNEKRYLKFLTNRNKKAKDQEKEEPESSEQEETEEETTRYYTEKKDLVTFRDFFQQFVELYCIETQNKRPLSLRSKPLYKAMVGQLVGELKMQLDYNVYAQSFWDEMCQFLEVLNQSEILFKDNAYSNKIHKEISSILSTVNETNKEIQNTDKVPHVHKKKSTRKTKIVKDQRGYKVVATDRAQAQKKIEYNRGKKSTKAPRKTGKQPSRVAVRNKEGYIVKSVLKK